MKNNNIQDERIIITRRKIQSDAYQILVYVLLASIVVQQFILHAPFSQFAFELFCLIGCGIYTTVRNLTFGIEIWNSKGLSNKKYSIYIFISGIISVILFAFLSGEDNIEYLIIFFICITAFVFFENALLRFIGKKKQDNITREMNQEEDELNE